MSMGSCVKCTPRPLRRSYSAARSSTAKLAAGMPSATSASLYGFTAGWLLGSSSSCGPSGASGDTTVSQRLAPTGTSALIRNPSVPV